MQAVKMTSLISLFIIYSALHCFKVTEAHNLKNATWITNERKLWHHLMDDYERSVRPVRHEDDVLDIGFEAAVLQIENLDERENVLHLNSWLRLTWKDVQLMWNPKDYGDIHSIKIEVDQLWIPDIVLYNSHSSTNSIYNPTHKTQVVVYSGGIVLWVPPVHLASSCAMDLNKYPYDTQVCQLKFGSWTYSGKHIKLNWYDAKGSLDTVYYQEDTEFELTDHKGEISSKTYACCPDEPYEDLTYTLTLKRRASYATHRVVAPSVMMCLILPVIFLLPPESKEKINLGVGLLIGNALVLITFTDLLPNGHPNMPAIGLYHIANMILTCISLAISAVVINIWSKGDCSSNMPNFIKSIVLGVCGRFLCIPRDNFMPVDTTVAVSRVRKLEVMSEGRDPSPTTDEDDREQILRNFAVAAQSAEWKQLAIIIDRLCFIIFIIIVFITTLAMATR